MPSTSQSFGNRAFILYPSPLFCHVFCPRWNIFSLTVFHYPQEKYCQYGIPSSTPILSRFFLCCAILSYFPRGWNVRLKDAHDIAKSVCQMGQLYHVWVINLIKKTDDIHRDHLTSVTDLTNFDPSVNMITATHLNSFSFLFRWHKKEGQRIFYLFSTFYLIFENLNVHTHNTENDWKCALRINVFYFKLWLYWNNGSLCPFLDLKGDQRFLLQDL